MEPRAAPGPPRIAADVNAVDEDETDEYFLTWSNYLMPSSLYYGILGKGRPEKLKTGPSFFKAEGLSISQHEATSKDGTKIPYFQVAPIGMKFNSSNPTLLYGYGGFEVPMLPGYNPLVGAAWLEKGGVYVVANIRGGGEFGPTWHQSALKEKRHRAYEDFAAVADDLVARKVTTPKHLGTMGGSNGGLLMGNMLTQYPEKFGAVVCQVPLLDMQRYHKLLAGASWMAEYGNPDEAKEWEFIKTFSPYHNVTAGAKYPRTLFTTSTRDDRVHPGHARKMMAKMMEMGHDMLVYENIEGGHGGAADNKQRGRLCRALAYASLWKQVKCRSIKSRLAGGPTARPSEPLARALNGNLTPAPRPRSYGPRRSRPRGPRPPSRWPPESCTRTRTPSSSRPPSGPGSCRRTPPRSRRRPT